MVLPDLPPRPTLRPGVHVVRRDATTLQIGVDPPERVLAPDSDGVRRLLAALREGRTPEPPSADALACLIDLLAAGLVVTADPPRPHIDAAVGVRGPDPLAGRAVAALTGAGVSTPRGVEPPAAWLVLSEGEPPREPIDDLVREGAPHLPVVSRCGVLEVGPFVSPGHTACLRCVDAHRAEPDPRRHLVVEQITHALADGAFEPRDELLWSLALAWAVRDLVRFAEGHRPSTWSTSFVIGPLDPPRRHEWARHPHCGCSWDALLAY